MANIRRKTASGNVAMVNWFQKQPNVQIVSLIPIEEINLPQNVILLSTLVNKQVSVGAKELKHQGPNRPNEKSHHRKSTVVTRIPAKNVRRNCFRGQVRTSGGVGCRQMADEIATRPRCRTLPVEISPTIGKTRTQQT